MWKRWKESDREQSGERETVREREKVNVWVKDLRILNGVYWAHFEMQCILLPCFIHIFILSSFFFGNHIGCRIINKFNLTYTAKTCQNMLVSSCLRFVYNFFCVFSSLFDSFYILLCVCDWYCCCWGRCSFFISSSLFDSLSSFGVLHTEQCEPCALGFVAESPVNGFGLVWFGLVGVLNWMSLLYALA